MRSVAKMVRTEEHKIEQKLRLFNHLMMIVFATILLGLSTDWAFSAIVYSASGPGFVMEFVDYWFGL
jgi:hypothetical protein